MNEYTKPNLTAKHFGVTQSVLRKWEKEGIITCIRTKANTGQRRYDIKSFKNPDNTEYALFNRDVSGEEAIKVTDARKSICYCRVSSSKQRDDLQRQVQHLESLYPGFEVIRDVGSGLNFKRKGLLSLLERTARGDIREVVVTHKDRLCRFGFEFLQWFFSFYRVKLIVLEHDRVSADTELANDILSIVHVFACRANGKRRYPKPEEEDLPEEENEESGKDK